MCTTHNSEIPLTKCSKIEHLTIHRNILQTINMLPLLLFFVIISKHSPIRDHDNNASFPFSITLQQFLIPSMHNSIQIILLPFSCSATTTTPLNFLNNPPCRAFVKKSATWSSVLTNTTLTSFIFCRSDTKKLRTLI